MAGFTAEQLNAVEETLRGLHYSVPNLVGMEGRISVSYYDRKERLEVEAFIEWTGGEPTARPVSRSMNADPIDSAQGYADQVRDVAAAVASVTSVGRCGESLHWSSGDPAWSVCSLPAGHAGWHHCDDTDTDWSVGPDGEAIDIPRETP